MRHRLQCFRYSNDMATCSGVNALARARPGAALTTWTSTLASTVMAVTVALAACTLHVAAAGSLRASCGSGNCGAPDAVPSPQRPNFVFIISESLDGRLLQAGSVAESIIPNIRALQALGSVSFETTYANSPVCAPSRSSLWSGRPPHLIPHMHNGVNVTGVWNNYEGLPASGPVSVRMDNILQTNASYAVSLAGKTDWTVGGHTLSCMLASLTFGVAWPYNINQSEYGGWNQEETLCASDGPVLPGGSGGPTGSLYGDDWAAVNQTASFIARANQPYFAYVGTNILHPPYGTNQYWFGRVAHLNVTVPEWPPLESLHPCDLQAAMKRGCTPGTMNASAYAEFYSLARREQVRRVYLAELAEFDAMVGALLEAVRARGDLDSTWFILTSDHGDMQMEHQMFYKMVAYEASAHVPLIFASPGIAAGGARVITQATQLLDIFPTVLRLAGVQVPAYARGYDLSPFLHGASADPSRPPYVAMQNADEDLSLNWAAVTDGRYKYIVHGDGNQVPPQLFNLTDDPGELRNVWNASAAYADLAVELDTALRAQINYPAVAMEIAAYQKAMFQWWASNTTDWQGWIGSFIIRWYGPWSEYPDAALAAVTAWMNNDTIALVPCNPSMATAAPPPTS